MDTNNASDNSVLGESAGNLPSDGTGKELLRPARITRGVLISPGIVSLDPWLSPFKDGLKSRYSKAQQWIKSIDEHEGGLEKFSRVPFPAHPSCLDWPD